MWLLPLHRRDSRPYGRVVQLRLRRYRRQRRDRPPNNTTAAAGALAVNIRGGATVRTVALLTAAEVDASAAAVKRATDRPPGSRSSARREMLPTGAVGLGCWRTAVFPIAKRAASSGRDIPTVPRRRELRKNRTPVCSTNRKNRRRDHPRTSSWPHRCPRAAQPRLQRPATPDERFPVIEPRGGPDGLR